MKSLEWLSPRKPSNLALEFDNAEGSGNVQGESERLIFCLLLH